MAYIKTTLQKEITVQSIVTIHYFEYMKDFVFHGESHDFWEFLYVDKGSVAVQAGEKRFHLNAGDIIFHEPDEFHAIRSVGNSSPNLVAVSFVCDCPAMDFLRQKTFSLDTEQRTLISMILRSAKDALDTPLHLPSVEQVRLKKNAPFGSQQLILLYLELFLISCIRNFYSEDPASRQNRQPAILPLPFTREGKKQKHLQEIIAYMQYHICEQLSMDQICSAFSMSRSAIQKLFHEEKGCGPMEYFSRLKIERAREIIRDGNRNFTEIAYFLSYSSLSYFSKQFRQSTGMSPREYANSIKGITNSLKGRGADLPSSHLPQ